MKAQEIFDKVVRHLYEQGRKASTKLDACMYRTKGGYKCAVGCLIEDDEYIKSMEGNGLLSLLREFPDTLSRLASHKDLLSSLQTAHDYGIWDNKRRKPNYLPPDVTRRLKDVAERYNLRTTVLDSLK